MPGDAVESMQSNLDRGQPAILASYGLTGAIMLMGGVGFLSDRYFGTGPWGVVAGLAVGLGIGFYQLSRLVRR
jgi:F0F1-type ATP synthase assembly protein I